MLWLTAHCTRCHRETRHEREKLIKDRYGRAMTLALGPAVVPLWLAAAGADLACEWRCTGCGTWRRLRFDAGRTEEPPRPGGVRTSRSIFWMVGSQLIHSPGG